MVSASVLRYSGIHWALDGQSFLWCWKATSLSVLGKPPEAWEVLCPSGFLAAGVLVPWRAGEARAIRAVVALLGQSRQGRS